MKDGATWMYHKLGTLWADRAAVYRVWWYSDSALDDARSRPQRAAAAVDNRHSHHSHLLDSGTRRIPSEDPLDNGYAGHICVLDLPFVWASLAVGDVCSCPRTNADGVDHARPREQRVVVAVRCRLTAGLASPG